MLKQPIVICVDFDGTVVTHEYPRIGKSIGAEAVLKELVARGHKLILWTMRSGNELREAVYWFEHNSIPLYGINENPTQKQWTQSPKAYAELYIDDAAINAPLKTHPDIERPFIDWAIVKSQLLG